VSQISPPIRILLVAGVVFLAAWFTVLKPKPVSVEPATTSTPPASGYGKAVDAAKKAAGQAPAETTPKTETEPKTGAGTATEQAPPAEAPATIPPEELEKLPKDVAAAIEDKKVLVLGVIGDEAKPWRPLADDDRYVRNTLKRVNTYDGDVVVKQVEAGKLSRYGALVNDLGVLQTPSVVVIDANLKGRVLTGYADRIAINQVIADAHDASLSPRISDPYLRELNAICGDYSLRVKRWSLPTVRGKKADLASVDRLIAINDRYTRILSRSDAPRKWRSIKAQMVSATKHTGKALAALRTAVKSGKAADFQAIDVVLTERDWTALDRRLDKAGVTNCVSNRRS
jgi:hypothetical protein